MNQENGIIKIYIEINDKKIQSKNKSNSTNFYKLILKNIEIKNESHEMKLVIVDDIEIKINLKLVNKFNILRGSLNAYQSLYGNDDNLKIDDNLNNNNNSNSVRSSIVSERIQNFNRASNADQDLKIKPEITKSTNIFEKSEKLKLLMRNDGPGLIKKTVTTTNFKTKIEEDLVNNFTKPTNNLEEDLSQRVSSLELNRNITKVDIALDSINLEKYLKNNNNNINRETFCSGFFLTSFPYKKGQVIENSQSYISPCNHAECSKFPAMKPEIIWRYPLKDTKELELNNLAATICFPSGIKVCYSEKEPISIKDYMSPITNQKGERYYMMTYHFYYKITNDEYTKKYEMHPLKHHLMKFGDAYLTLNEKEFTPQITNAVEKALEFCQEIGFREYVYVPYCLCLISKYPYISEMRNCLQSIYMILTNTGKFNFEINDLILHLIHSIPIPDKNSRIKFFTPYNKSIIISCPIINGLRKMNIDYLELTKYFTTDNIIIIFRLLISEKRILFIHDDYTILSKVTDAFTSLLYPFNWVHTYIPIMSDQMLNCLETFLPFVNGIHTSLMPKVIKLFKESESDDSDEVFLIYIKDNEINLSGNLKNKKIKISKYIENNVLSLPSNFEKELKKNLERFKENYDSLSKSLKKSKSLMNSEISNNYQMKFRDAFIEIFVECFYEYSKYVCLLDNDVIFNKNLFMKNVKHNKKFYDEFTDSQLFEVFIQNIFSDNSAYFNQKITERENNKNNPKKRESVLVGYNNADKSYFVKPDYLNLGDDFEKKLAQNFTINQKLDEDGIISLSKRVCNNINEIKDDNYIFSKCLIYLLPVEFDKSMNLAQLLNKQLKEKINAQKISPPNDRMRRKTTVFNPVLDDKERDNLRDEIKDYVIKIFQSGKLNYEKDAKMKKDILNLISNKTGIRIFLELISHNNTGKIILLQFNNLKFIGFIIHNALGFLSKLEETSDTLELCVQLFKCTKLFGKEDQGKETTLFKTMIKTIQSYQKINQINFWKKYYEIILKERFNNAIASPKDKQKIIVEICKSLIELECSKTFIKKCCDEITFTEFDKESDIAKETSSIYLNEINTARYTSRGAALF